MNRRDFLAAIPKVLAMSGVAMGVVGEMLDAQPGIYHPRVKVFQYACMWRHDDTKGHVYYSLRDTFVYSDGKVAQRLWGETCIPFVTTENETCRRAPEIIVRLNQSDYNIPPGWA